MSQIVSDRWSNGRVALLGDAGYCASPLSGQGTSLALVGAYVLAGALAAAPADHRVALRRYEDELRPFVARNQQFALDVSRWQETQDGPQPDVGEVSRSYAVADLSF
jgi:2-polyprenyl-6-methoxyphenol hydroxylase-like FAD-dependent oxidoreductase